MQSPASGSVATTRPMRRHFAPHRLAGALAAGSLLTLPLPPAQAQALPTGVSVVHGQAQVTTSGNRMTVVNTPQTVLNWNSFSIGANNSVYFQQASATSQVLNRVVGNDPSAIFGSLGSNGRVWLLNPNGVLFGQNARVDVAGLVSSTLRLNDADWLAGRYRFSADGPGAEVVNRGELRSTFGGTVALIGSEVRNEGLVQAPGGQIILAAGRSVELVDTGAPNVGVRITAPTGTARNLGELQAAGGRIDIHAAAVNQQGIVSADALTTGAGGEIWIKASDSLSLGAGSRTSADGLSGGRVHTESTAGRSTVEGSVSAQGAQGPGGQVVMLGREVGLMNGSGINASGQGGGGEVLVGGGERGQDSRYVNAQAVYFAPLASITADALAQGDGGRIVLWSDTSTRAFGALSARGGAASGNGGFIETSGGWLDARPAKVDLQAPRGKGGRWLLDPHDIEISDSVSDSGFDASFTATSDTAQISSATITAAIQADTDVTISTGGAAGSQQGNITVSGATIIGAVPNAYQVLPNVGGLTLRADGNITVVNSQLGTSDSPLQSANLLAGLGGTGVISMSQSGIRSFGTVQLAADRVALQGSSIATYFAVIWVSGRNNTPLSGFTSVSSALSSSFQGGGWVVYAASDSAPDFQPGPLVGSGGLNPAFLHYGATSSDWGFNFASASAGGFAFASPKVFTYTGTVASRPYDGTTQASFQTIHVDIPAGYGLGLVDVPEVSFIDKNAGVDKPARLDAIGLSIYFGPNGQRIHGFTLDGSFKGTITPVPITGIATSAANKVYDASAAAQVNVGSVSGLIGSETVFVDTTAHFDSKNIGDNRPVTVTDYRLLDGSNGGLAINYSFTPLAAPALTASITPRPLSITSLAIGNKVYDGTTAATLSGAPVIDAMGGDDVALGAVSARFNDKNVGLAKPVQVNGLSLVGADAGNYLLQPASTQFSADITPRPLDLSGVSVASKVYDGTTAASLAGSAVLTALPGDQVFMGGSAQASFIDKNVGTGKTILLSGLTLSGPDAGNYTASAAQNVKADITPKPVVITGLGASDKVYDGTVAASLTGTASVGVITGDSAVLGGTPVARFADKNAGTDKPVTVSGLTLTGGDAGNYTLAPPQGLSADITPRDLVPGGLSVSNKVYDATTTATLSGSISLLVLPGDVVTTAGTPVIRFVDKNVGQDKPVSITGFTLAGADAGNYTLGPATGLHADITPRPLTLSGLVALSKVYDATTLATLTGTASVNGLPGDAVSLSGTPGGNFADKNVGQNKTVTLNGSALTGADAGNYTLVSASSLSADITPRPLALVGLAAADKVYDATTAATLIGTGSFNSLPGDVVALGGALSASFADKNVGQGKVVTVTGLSLSGADAGNYSLQAAPALQASITPRGIAVTGLAASDKVYDGSTAAALSGTGQVQALAGDAVSLAGAGVAAFADPDVGTGKPVNLSGFTLTGADAGNYTLTRNAALLAAITPAALQYVAATELRPTGLPPEDLRGSVSGFVAGENQANATQGTLLFSTAATAASPPGSYAVLGSGLSARNYVFSQAPGNAQALTLVTDLGPVTNTVVDADRSKDPTFTATLPWLTSSDRGPPLAGTLDLSTPGTSAGRSGGTIDGSAGTTTGGGTTSDSSIGVAMTGVSTSAGRSEAQAGGEFKAVKLSGLSTDQLQALLDARRLFKQNLLADAVVKLERDPALADLRECLTLQDAERGVCLITPRLKERLGLQHPATTAPAAPAVAAAPAPGAPTSPAAARPSPAPSTATTPAAVQQAALPPALPSAQQLDLAKRKVLSASLPQIERKIALIIGVDRYTDPSIPSLSNAVRDAHAVAKVFGSKLGYEAVVIDNATKPAVVAALNQLALTVGPRDSVVVYYAGHGELVESTRLGYWLLSDSVAKQPETWLSNTDISRLIAQIGASQVALVSDSCYSGSLASEERIRPQASPPNPQSILDRKSVVVMSSGGNEPVFDEGKDGHSPFAYNLMNTLNQVSSWQAGGNVFERVRFAVARTLPQRPQYSASRAAGHQAGGDYLFEQRQLYLTR